MEIEVKILDIDGEAIRKKLIELGAEKVFEGRLEATYFDFPDKTLRKNKITLRIRKENEETVLAVKKKVDTTNTKIMEEHETVVSDFETCKTQLETLGYEPYWELKKTRESYKLNNSKIEFDNYDAEDIPEFLEIESPREEEIFAVAEKLGFSKKQCLPWTGKQVLSHYRKSS